jgi:hypothetical protein
MSRQRRNALERHDPNIERKFRRDQVPVMVAHQKANTNGRCPSWQLDQGVRLAMMPENSRFIERDRRNTQASACSVESALCQRWRILWQTAHRHTA